MAKAFISKDENIADEFPLDPASKLLQTLANKNNQSSKGAFNSNKIVLPSNNVFNSFLGASSVFTGGARNPFYFAYFSQTPLFIPKPENTKLSRINAIQYTYKLSGFFDRDKANMPPAGISDFSAPIYFNLSQIFQTNAEYDNFVAGSTVRKDRFINLNSFKIGTLRYKHDAIFGLGAFKIEGLEGQDTMEERIDWTVPVPERPVALDGGDVLYYDFEGVDPKKITEAQLNEALSGNLNNIACAVSVDMTGQTTANFNMINQFGGGDQAMTIFGNVVFDVFGVAVSYTPVI